MGRLVLHGWRSEYSCVYPIECMFDIYCYTYTYIYNILMPADALRGVHAGQTTEPEVSAKLLASSGRNWWQAFGIEDPLLKKSDKESQLCNLCTLQFSPFTCASALSADVAYHLLALHTAGIHRK